MFDRGEDGAASCEKLLQRYGYCYRLLTSRYEPLALDQGDDDMSAIGLDGLPIGECTRDPEAWVTRADEEAKAICRGCPRRWSCAREAVELPRAEGLWAGIVIPEAGRGRTFALRQLRSLAEQNGYSVRTRRIFAESA
jgi:WhiB family transcriptional regulator, redox-sensing transcriptional regulator